MSRVIVKNHHVGHSDLHFRCKWVGTSIILQATPLLEQSKMLLVVSGQIALSPAHIE